MYPSSRSRHYRRYRSQTLSRSIAPCIESLEGRQLLSATTNPGGAPNAPFGLAATATSPTAVQFSFYDSANNETGFVVSRATGNGAFAPVAQLDASPGSYATVTFNDTGLTAGQTYRYEVTAINGPYNSSTAGPASVTTPTATPTPTPTPTPTETPYEEVPFWVPGKIEVEFFDNGGEGLAYHDSDAANNGGAYRLHDGVDIESSGDTGDTSPGFDVGWTHAGEWMNYMVNVTATGTYNLDVRAANVGSGAAFHVEVDGVNVTGSLAVPDTGGWQTYTDVTKGGISLTAGQHVLRLAMDANAPSGYAGNYNWMSFTAATPTPTPTPTGSLTADTTFGTAGTAHIAGLSSAQKVATTLDGKTVYVLETTNGQDSTIAATASSGAAATAFGGGVVDLGKTLPQAFDNAWTLAVQPDGKVLVSVALPNNGGIGVARYNADGTLDTSFGNAHGELVVNYGGGEWASALAVAPNGQIYVGGSRNVYQSTALEFYAVRLNANGSIDQSYGYNGMSHGDGQAGLRGWGMALDPADGSVVVVGEAEQDNSSSSLSAIVGTHLLPNGNAAGSFTLDADYRYGGIKGWDVAVQPDGKAVVIGDGLNTSTILRVNADGTPDSTWTDPILAVKQRVTGAIHISSITRLSDGTFVAAGSVNAQTSTPLVIHVWADGTIDPNNGVNMPTTNQGFQPNGTFQDVTQAADGAVYVAGYDPSGTTLTKYLLA